MSRSTLINLAEYRATIESTKSYWNDLRIVSLCA